MLLRLSASIIQSNRILCKSANAFILTWNRKICVSSSDWKRVAFNLSDIGEGIREVIVKEWYVKEGDVVEQFENLCEVQSDKASVTITSRYDGKILKIHHKVDDTAFVGKPLLDFDVFDDLSNTQSDEFEIEEPNRNKNVVETKTQSSNELPNRMRFLATPAVRRIAGENKVNLAQVKASGRFGRILKGDVLEYLNVFNSNNETFNRDSYIDNEATDKKATHSETDKIEKLKDVRKIMFKTMTNSLKIPHFTYSDEVNVTDLVRLRDILKVEAQSMGFKLTFMPFFIKAASIALKKYPILNSVVDEENEAIIYKSEHNISIAMATKNGLVVPNIKNCEQKSVRQIAIDLNELIERGRNGKLVPDNFSNGTFSISNIGNIGATYTHPVIAPPQVAIGAIGTTQILPRFLGDSDQVYRAHITHISWSADHRVIDGVTMASFSNEWKGLIENPHKFIIQ